MHERKLLDRITKAEALRGSVAGIKVERLNKCLSAAGASPASSESPLLDSDESGKGAP